MTYVQHTEDDIRGMLEVVGADSVEALFGCIPDRLRLIASDFD